MLISRSDKGLVADWWFTVDRVVMGCVLVLMAAGVLFSMAASPPVAARIGLDPFHFFTRQFVFLIPAILVLLATSMLTTGWARRVALLTFFAGLAAMVAALFVGPEIKGAHRWLDLGPINVQPSEFVKPAFAVAAAWFLAEGTRRPDMPGTLIAFVLFALFAGLLVLQPDFGQLVLITIVFATLLLIHGIAWVYIFGLGGLAAGMRFGSADGLHQTDLRFGQDSDRIVLLAGGLAAVGQATCRGQARRKKQGRNHRIALHGTLFRIVVVRVGCPDDVKHCATQDLGAT